MAEEVIRYLEPRRGGIYLDGTLGGGGHARLILEVISPDGILVGLDHDAEALQAAGRNLAEFGDRVVLRQGNFSGIDRDFAAARARATAPAGSRPGWPDPRSG